MQNIQNTKLETIFSD